MANFVIIKLQNLPSAANSVDIRRYFTGLSILESGIHIIGGENGDAFIAFSTDEDARQAMERDGGKIKDMKIKLLLSSRTEMIKNIEQVQDQNQCLQTPSDVKGYEKGYGMIFCADPYNSVRNFGNYPDVPTYSTVQTAKKSAVPAVPYDRKNVLPRKPAYEAEHQTLRRPDLRPREEDLCVEIEGFPASCTEDDLIHFFDGLATLDIIMKENPDDRGTVLGYVEFARPVDFYSALDLTGKMIGHRYITVTTSSKEMMTSAQKNKRVRKEPSFPQSLSRDSAPPSTHRGPNKNPRPIPQDRPMYCVAINGLPEMVKNHDITDFFAEDKIVPRAIHIILDSGKGFAEFISLHELEIAVQKNGKFLAGSRVSVDPITYQEMIDMLKGPSSAPPLFKNPSEDRPTRRPLMPMPPPREEEMAFRERRPLDDIPPDNFRPNRYRSDSRYSHNERSFDHLGRMGVRPPFSRLRSPVFSRSNNRPPRPALFGSDGPPPCFSSEGPPPCFGSDGPPPRFGSNGPLAHFGSNGPLAHFGSKGPLACFGSNSPLARFDSNGPPPHFHSTGPQRGPLLPPNDGPQDFGMPGCVVSINNLHFLAGLKEIMEAFQGFPLVKDKMIRKYNDKGQATGEARIAFQCHKDATRAVEEVNQKIIFGRPIYLSIV